MEVKVTVIIPIYNGECFLDKCITSVLDQIWTDFELILVDDGSTDRSWAICQSYQARDPRVLCVRQENAGVSRARNRGLDLAKGEFITFVDADDWLDREYLRQLLEVQKLFASDLTVCEHTNIAAGGKTDRRSVFDAALYARDKEIASRVIPKILSNGTRQRLCSSFCALYKKELLDVHDIRFCERLKLNEDTLFVFHYAQYCASFYYLPESLYYRLIHGGSAIHSCREQIYQECEEVCRAYLELSRRFGWRDKEDVHFYINVLIYDIFAYHLRYPESEKNRRELRREYKAFLAGSPMNEMWKQVRLSRCRGVKEFFEVACIKMGQPAVLRFAFRLWWNWIGRS